MRAAALLLVVVLAGCSQSGDSDSPSTDESVTALSVETRLQNLNDEMSGASPVWQSQIAPDDNEVQEIVQGVCESLDELGSAKAIISVLEDTKEQRSELMQESMGVSKELADLNMELSNEMSGLLAQLLEGEYSALCED